ncbi:MAG: GDSL-type esterase/lipase family protein [Bacteroidia bacterium]|nr:GDSL-type esterase/lipase family protein [Bacteroidia bacterium]
MSKKTTIGLFLAALTATACQKEANHYDATSEYFTYMGRTITVTDLTEGPEVRFNYPGSSIYTQFTGNKIEIQMRPGSGSFMVTIDDNTPKRIEFDENTSSITIDSIVGEEPHKLSIMLATEGYEHNPTFYGLNVDGELSTYTLPETKLLFIGNSITCGYGVEDSIPSNPFNYLTENHYHSYAAITARTIGAQWHSISRSGIGIYRNYGDVREGSQICMRQQFHRTLFDNESFKWDHSTYQPDVIMLNLGTNDTSLDNYDKELLQSGYDEFVDTLRQLFPTSKIVLLTGSMLNGQALVDVKDCLDNTCKRCNDNGDNDVYRFDMTPQNGNLGFGADYHPSMKQQQKMADELISFLNNNILTSKN